MKTLMLMRHSHAVSNNPAFTDHERPLTPTGRELARTTGEVLKSHGLVPDCIVCSSATRTHETADILRDSTGSSASPSVTDELYLARPDAYPIVLQHLAVEDNSTVLAIGHNPGIANLVNSWTDEYLAITPASVAVFAIEIDNWAEFQDTRSVTPTLTNFFSDGVRYV